MLLDAILTPRVWTSLRILLDPALAYSIVVTEVLLPFVLFACKVRMPSDAMLHALLKAANMANHVVWVTIAARCNELASTASRSTTGLVRRVSVKEGGEDDGVVSGVGVEC